MYNDDMDILENNITIEKSVDKENVIVGDCIKYNVTVINEGDILINNVTIIDMLDSALEFKSGSIILGDLPLPDENILSGVDIGCLAPGQIKILTFRARVICRPSVGYIENSAVAKFYYDVNQNRCLRIMDKTSNIVCIKVDVADLQIIKNADKDKVSIGEYIEYEVEVTNVGTLQARNILFSDKIPKEVSLVEDTFEVDGRVVNNIGQDIDVYIGSLYPGESIRVSYVVKVNSSNCSGLLVNKASAKFNYNLYKDSFGEKLSSCSDYGVSEVRIGISTFKQLSIDDTLCIPDVKPDIEEINDMNVEGEIIECHVISTPSVISNEGQTLSGYKLIVRGVLREIIEYTADTAEQSVHSAHYSLPFSSFIVLPENYVPGSKLDVAVEVEDIYYKKIDPRCFFKNITILINVKIMSC